jgi:heat shock 70kDa protein 1/2/6/8
MTDLINKYFEETLETEEKINIEYVIGIDLGTCNSCCSIWRNNAAEVIPDEYGNRTIPSVVSFTNKTVYIGVEARNQLLLAPKNAYYEIKRLIGKKMNDKTVLGDKKFLTYELRADKNDNVAIVYEKDGNEKLLSPEELSSYILMKLKKMASDYLKSPVSKAVISVPAYFNDAQRQATRDAATIAGLECIRIISEPVASALAYGLNKLTKISREGDTYVVVYDLGGGTLDVSLLTINDGIFEVIGSAGNTHLGGVDFDNRIFEYCINVFKTNHINFDETIITAEASQKLRKACENAKKVLSSTAQTTIGVINFFNGENLIVNLTRTKFNDICNDLRMLCLQPLSDILLNCEIKKEAINEIILVGGMTRVPSIREDIQRFFNKCPNSSINPDEIVSVGAAIQGHILVHKNDPFSDSITLLDTTALSLGIETIG